MKDEEKKRPRRTCLVAKLSQGIEEEGRRKDMPERRDTKRAEIYVLRKALINISGCSVMCGPQRDREIIQKLKKRTATTICKWGNILSFSLTAKVMLIN